MNKENFLYHKTGVVGDPVTYLNSFQPSTDQPLKDWRDEDYPGTPDNIAKGDTWVGTWNTERSKNQARIRSYRSFLLHDLQGFGGRMTFFWMNHFGIADSKVLDADMMYEYYELIRKHSVGDFREMIQEITINPAMLRFLDGETNKKNAPNANYARELMELFTLGRDNGYTETDINEAARALTGWEIQDKKALFAIQNWDAEPKSVFGEIIYSYGDLINRLFDERGFEISNFIAGKLIRYFLGKDNNVLRMSVAAQLALNWSIKDALTFMFTHDEFYNPQYMTVKSPLNLIHSLPLSLPNDINYYHIYSKLLDRCEQMGLDILNPPSVEGYSPYNEAPDYSKLWYNGSSGVLRSELVDQLFDPWAFTMDDKYMFFIDVMNEQVYADPNVQVQLVVEKYLPTEWPVDELNTLKTNTLLSGQAEDRYWANAVTAYLADPNQQNTSVVRERLKALYMAVFSHEEFQLQ